jgi:hypothetical protein
MGGLGQPVIAAILIAFPPDRIIHEIEIAQTVCHCFAEAVRSDTGWDLVRNNFPIFEKAVFEPFNGRRYDGPGSAASRHAGGS